MTNGEKIKEIFPYLENDNTDLVKALNIDNLRRWWNAEYIESITKNNLEVDCISRFEVTEILNSEYDIDKMLDRVDELPSVTPQEPRWIPISEKLPNDRDWYLGIFKEPDTGWINPLPFICDYVGRETKATTKEYWILRGFTDWDDYHIDYYFNLECVAWMPLPLPWKGE